MADTKDPPKDLFSLLKTNENIVTNYYKLSTFVFLGVVIAHIFFSSIYIFKYLPSNYYQVLQFATFNITILIIEVFISRITFMLGSRAGQLKDIRLCLLISELDFPIENFKAIATSIMLMRRDENKLKILDIEKLFQNLQKPNKKP